MADKTVISLFKNDFYNSELYNSIIDKIFDVGFVFGTGISNETIDRYFDGYDFDMSFDPAIEAITIDLYTLNFKGIKLSFTDADGNKNYLKTKYAKDKKAYLISYVNKNPNSIIVDSETECFLPNQIVKEVLANIKNKRVDEIEPIRSNLYFNFKDKTYLYFAKNASKTAIELVQVLAYKPLLELYDNFDKEDISIISFAADLNDLENPFIYSAYIQVADDYYHIWFGDEIEYKKCEDPQFGQDPTSILTYFVELAEQNLVESYRGLIYQQQLDIYKKEVDRFIEKFNYLKIEKDNDCYYFPDLSDEPFMRLDDFIHIKTSRNDDKAEERTFDYEKISSSREQLDNIVLDYIKSNSKEYDDFIIKTEEFLDNKTTYQRRKELSTLLIEEERKLPPNDTKRSSHIKLMKNIREKINEINGVDNAKISRVLGLLKEINNEETYNAFGEELFDAIDDLSDMEESVIRNDLDLFAEQFGDISEYHPILPTVRRVYIRKSVLAKLRELNDETPDLKILSIVDQIVEQLKTLPGNQLGKYLLVKGLNFPINNDRTIKKIRIMRNVKYRLVFLYGSDLGGERIDNADSIYIFALIEHKKEKGELDKLPEQKPSKYQINDFVLYPKNKLLKIPECSIDQYKIAKSYEDLPIITFGCAGSGKTTVSIEQYVNIVWSQYYPDMPKEDELVYITYHKRLAEKAEKDLAEFNIAANCYSLYAYFAHVTNIDLSKKVVVNEAAFIAWFNKYYSASALNKYKRRDNIAPLLSKPDIARLLFTYYRGVFTGSKDLFDTKEKYLTKQQFISAMRGESYLSDEEKEAIYGLCVEFYEYGEEHNYISDNDLAIQVVRLQHYGLKKTACIIIDEVQDLTEIEIIAVALTLKDGCNRIYYYGDPHQSINPNVFDSSTINGVYSTLGKISASKSKPLDTTYRTNFHLINYLKMLEDYRDKWIGLTKGGISKINAPADTESSTSWAGYVTNKKLHKQILESNFPNCMIITPSEEIRMALLKQYPTVKEARVITIYEAKGMEWDTVIMYNMFTDYKRYFMDMISENGAAKKSTIHRMTFNKYYVGCTRSTKSFVLIEEDSAIFDESNPIFKILISSFAPIYKTEQVKTYILEDNTFEGWYQEALQNMDNDNDFVFNHALLHAQKLASTGEQRKMIQELLDSNPEVLIPMGKKYLAEKQYDFAHSIFVKCHKKTKLYDAYICICRLMLKKNITEEQMKTLMKNTDVLFAYPEALAAFMNVPLFKAKLNNVINRLYKKGSN